MQNMCKTWIGVFLGFFTSYTFAQDTLSSQVINNLIPPPTISSQDQNWWLQFGYRELDSLIQLALKQNNTLKVYQHRVRAAKAKRLEARSNLYPVLSVHAGYRTEQLSGNRPTGFSANVGAPQTIVDNYTLGGALSYEVDYLGKWINQMHASNYEYTASKERLAYTSLQIAADVSQVFFNLLTVNTELHIVERTLEIRNKNVNLNQIRFAAGLASNIDLQRSKSEYNALRTQLQIIRQQKKQLEITLATLCAADPEDYHSLDHQIAYTLPVTEDPIWAEIEIYLQRRQDIKERKALEQASRLYLKSQQKEYLPFLQLQGSYGYLSINNQTLVESQSSTWLGLINLNVPIFGGFRRRAQVKQAKEDLKIAATQLRETQNKAQGQIAKALSDKHYLQEQVKSQKELLEAAQQSDQLAHALYLTGFVTYLEVVDADRVVLNAERKMAQLIGQQLSNAVELIRSVGGGEI